MNMQEVKAGCAESAGAVQLRCERKTKATLDTDISLSGRAGLDHRPH